MDSPEMQSLHTKLSNQTFLVIDKNHLGDAHTCIYSLTLVFSAPGLNDFHLLLNPAGLPVEPGW